MRGMNSVAMAPPASFSMRSHSQRKSEHFILRMRAFSFSVSCGSGLAATGLGTEPVEGRSSTFMSMLAATGVPFSSMAGRKREFCSTLISCGSKPSSVVFSSTVTSPTLPDSSTRTVATN